MLWAIFLPMQSNPISPIETDVYVSWKSQATRRYDFASRKRSGRQCRQTFPLQRQPLLGGSSRKDATRIYMWDTRERSCLTSNSKYIRQTTHSDDSWQFWNAFLRIFSGIRKITNIEILRLFSILWYSKCVTKNDAYTITIYILKCICTSGNLRIEYNIIIFVHILQNVKLISVDSFYVI